MEDASDPEVESVTIMAASQILKTTVLENVIGYFIDVDPAPILVVQPTEHLAESFSKERLSPMIRDTPALREKVVEASSRRSGNTILMKSFPGGNIALVGANAPAGLAGRPRRVLLQDEIDRYPASAGTEGDPCALAEKRTATFWNAVIYRVSSPTLKGFSRIEAAFELTDKRMWFCKCPRCGSWQTLKWKNVIWETQNSKLETQEEGQISKLKSQISKPPAEVWYQCENEGCQANLTDAERLKMIRAGEWRATAPFSGKRGYFLNGIYAPWKDTRGYKSGLQQMVGQFLEAKAKGRETLRAWTNTFLAESWEEVGEQIEHGTLIKRAEGYTPGKLSAAVLIVIAGVDVQRDRLECETIGIGLDDESWGIEAIRFFGDTEQDQVWRELGDHLGKRYKREDGVELGIAATAIDMGHRPHKVRRFAQKGGVARVYPVYGTSSTTQAVLVRPRKDKHYRIWTFAVQTKLAKDTIFARLRVDDPGPRYMHFPKGHGYSEEWFEQLTAESLKTTYKHGFPVQQYEKTRERNEALDIRVYGLAAIDILRPALTTIAKNLKGLADKNSKLQTSNLKGPEPASGPGAAAPVKKRRRIQIKGIGGWKI